MKRSLWSALCVAIFISVWSFPVGASDLVEPTPQEAEDIKRWIPVSCCRTSGCCRKVPESALITMPQDNVKVVATGQVLKRTGWSQDKNTWRCTCDLIEGQWVVHMQANTRCTFPKFSGY